MPLRRFGRPGLIGTAARTAVVVGTASAVSGAVARQSQARAPEQVAPAPAPRLPAPAQSLAPPAAAPSGDLIAQLEQLAQLRAAGVLSVAEFSAAKAKLLC
ncbi:MAG: SHOCT domain-containing protein [Propionicimonas sp.]